MAASNQSNRVALITGANRGIGFEIARQLARREYRVIIGSRDLKSGLGAAKKINAGGSVQVEAAELDVTDEKTVRAVESMVRTDFGRLDALVNNAGVLLDEGALPSTTTPEVVRSTFEVNLVGAWRLCNAFAPVMKKRRYGRIVNISSGAGSFEELSGSTYAPAYSVSKAALNALTAKLASELSEYNVLVNVMCPGWVKTRMGGPGAPRSPAEGADTAVWLATLPDDGPSGGFFRDRGRIAW